MDVSEGDVCLMVDMQKLHYSFQSPLSNNMCTIIFLNIKPFVL